MGTSSTTRGPITEKITSDGGINNLKYGHCEMQGWRSNMEDATIAVVDSKANFSLFGVLDGHGGSIISKFVACNFVNLLTQMKSYRQKNYEQALIETYLKFDELLRLDKVNQFLKQNNTNNKGNNKLEITFSYRSQSKSNLPEEIKDEKENLRLNQNNENRITKRNSDETQSPDIVQIFIPKENIIDLNKKNSTSNTSANNSKKDSEGENKSKSKEILTLGGEKFEISLKNSSDQFTCNDFEELIAKDIGTTATILFIKNNYLYLANVGDSLAICFKNGVASKLNLKHKTTLQSESSRILKSGLKIINNRIEGRLNLTRAIGDLNFKKNPKLKFYEQAVTAYPEIIKLKITKDIEFVIMACDGVWDCVDEQKICEEISSKLKSKKSISYIISELFDNIISKANNTPVGTDNMSCIIIQFLHD